MNSLAAAKRRRAGIQSSTPEPQNAPVQPQPMQPKMNIVQYLATLEKRVVTLETQKQAIQTEDETLNHIQVEVETSEGKSHIPIVTFMESMDARFQMLVEEIASIKDTVLKLQTFTMEVNQKLFHELTATAEPEPETTETFSEEVTLTVDPSVDENKDIVETNDDLTVEDVSGNSETDDIQIGYRQNQKKKGKNK